MGKIKQLHDGTENVYPVTTDEAVVVKYEDSEGDKVGTLKEYVQHVVDQGVGGISADDVLDTAITAGVAVGNVVKNQTFAIGTTVEEVLQAIFTTFTAPTVTVECSGADKVNGEENSSVTTNITYTVKLGSIPLKNITSFVGNDTTIAFSDFTDDGSGIYTYTQNNQTCTATKTFTGKLNYKDPRTNAGTSVQGTDTITFAYPMYYLGLKSGQDIATAIAENGVGTYPGVVTFKAFNASNPSKLETIEFADGAKLAILTKTEIKKIINPMNIDIIGNFTKSTYEYNGVNYISYTYNATPATQYNLSLTY